MPDELTVGLSSWAFPWAIGVPDHRPPSPMDAFGLLEVAGAQGVALVQIADNLPLHEMSSSALRRLADAAHERGIAIEVGTAGMTRERLAEYLAIARTLRSDLVRIVIDFGEVRPDRSEILAVLRSALPEYAHAGVRIGIENHDRFRAAALAELMVAVDSPCVGICLDTINSLAQIESVEHVLATLRPWIVNVHVKDFTIRRVPNKMGYLVEGAPAGQGDLDLYRLLRDAGTLPRRATVVLEQWPSWRGDLAATIACEADWARSSLQAIRLALSGQQTFARGDARDR